MPPASLGGSPKSVGGLDPGSSQISASVLGPISYEILCTHFKSRVSISYSPQALPKVSSLTFKKPNILQAYFPDTGPPGWRAPHGIWTSHALEKTSEIIIILPFMGHPSRGQRRQWHPTPILLPGKSHGRRSLVGCSRWGRYESDTTERLHFHFSLSCIGEGNSNPLQCSCLENPRDGGAWWAAVYGVT